MTVGIAVVSREGAIIGAADRAITWGAIKTEPRRSKIMHFNNCPISVLWAGSVSMASQVLAALGGMVTQRSAANITVEGMAHTASYCIARVYGSIAEIRHLAPFGHTRASLLRGDCGVAPEERSRLLGAVEAFQPDEGEAIELLFSGYDPDGFPRIYRVLNRLPPSDHTLDGYATIGSGGALAEEILHRHGYARQHTTHWQALLLTYMAKVEAEDDLWVGTKSNFVGREPKSQRWARIPSRLVRVIDRAYRQLKREERATFKRIAADIPAEFKRQMPELDRRATPHRAASKRVRRLPPPSQA